MMKKLILAVSVVAASVAFAQGTAEQRLGHDKPAEKKGEMKPPDYAAMPEVKKVVDTFKGKWAVEGTATMGSEAPVAVKATMDCKPVAANTGLDCTMTSEKGSKMPMTEQCLMAHDPMSGTGVHLMCVTSMGEVHDHHGKWADEKTIKFDTFKFTTDGKPSTEDMTLNMTDAKTGTMTNTMDMGGQKMSMQTTMKKK